MLVGEKLIYLQLQKTGSTRITDLIQATVGAEERHKHDRIRREDLADPEIAARRIIGSIRNPWSYYVSLWSYGSRRAGGIYERTTASSRMDQPRDQRGVLHKKTIPMKDRDWRARRRVKKWKTAYGPPDDREAFRRWIRFLNHPDYRIDVGEGYGKSSISWHSGLLTYRYLVLFTLGVVPGEPHLGGHNPTLDTLDKLRDYADENILCQDMIRMEHLSDELEASLVAAGYELTDEQRAMIHGKAEGRSENRTKHHPAAWYYDDETRDLVAERDRFVIERHGYEFG
jgi:hypothetical protein